MVIYDTGDDPDGCGPGAAVRQGLHAQAQGTALPRGLTDACRPSVPGVVAPVVRVFQGVAGNDPEVHGRTDGHGNARRPKTFV
jgi:hypothetical protein